MNSKLIFAFLCSVFASLAVIEGRAVIASVLGIPNDSQLQFVFVAIFAGAPWILLAAGRSRLSEAKMPEPVPQPKPEVPRGNPAVFGNIIDGPKYEWTWPPKPKEPVEAPELAALKRGIKIGFALATKAGVKFEALAEGAEVIEVGGLKVRVLGTAKAVSLNGEAKQEKKQETPPEEDLDEQFEVEGLVMPEETPEAKPAA